MRAPDARDARRRRRGHRAGAGLPEDDPLHRHRPAFPRDRSEQAGLSGTDRIAARSRGCCGRSIRGSVTVHAFDPRGLEPALVGATPFVTIPRDGNGSHRSRRHLRRLPEYTGGRTFVNMNQPEQSMPTSSRRAGRITSLRSSERLRVRTAGRTRYGSRWTAATSVVGRTAYVDAVAEASKKSSGDPLARALGELLPRNDVSLRMTLAPGETKDSSLDVTLATPCRRRRAPTCSSAYSTNSANRGIRTRKVDLPARQGGSSTGRCT